MSEVLCPDATKTKITIAFGDNSVKKIEFNSGDISVNREDKFEIDNNSPIKCWRFSGEGYDDRLYEHFATGTTPSYQPASPGLGLYMDGIRLVGDFYFYKPGASIGESTIPINRTANVISSGNCDTTTNTIKYHEYTFTDTNNNVIKVKGLAESKLVSGCDDGCPEGEIKCDCDEFPGYCCIPCEEIRSGIRDATEQLRRKLNGV